MGIPTVWAEMFFRHWDSFATGNPPESSSWLSIGTVDYEVSPAAAIRLGFYDAEKFEAFVRGGGKDGELNKQLCAGMIRKLGYGTYVQLDINDRADIAWDLNQPVPDEYRNQFQMVYDAGSIEHIANPFQGCTNLLLMAKVGGRIVHSQGIGDQTDQGYWTFNPGFVLDFYRANGCVLKEIFILDLDGAEFIFKIVPGLGGLHRYLDTRSNFLTSMQLLRHALQQSRRPGLWQRAAVKLLDKFVGHRVKQSPSFSMIAIFEKQENVEQVTTALQAMYAADSILPAACTSRASTTAPPLPWPTIP